MQHLPLSSANSINIGRLLPQSVYYFYAASRLAQPGEPIVFAVPSGNFGDMMGAVVAGEMGLPVRKIVVPVNGNDAFPQFLATGSYAKISPSRNCLSNAMNVGHPSNLARLVAVYGGQMDETGKIHQQPGPRRDAPRYFFDLHLRRAHRGGHPRFLESVSTAAGAAWRRGVAGFSGLGGREPLGNSPAVIVETANPAKFPVEVEKVVGWEPDVPANMLASLRLPEDFDRMDADYEKFKAICWPALKVKTNLASY